MRSTPYALITGASQGLGKSLALECAKRNMNLILVALPSSGLTELSNFIRHNFDVIVEDVEMDLSIKDNCISLFTDLQSRRLPINILINNAGIGGTHGFEEKSTEFYYRQIELNVSAPTLLCRLFLDTLCENSPAYIMNVSSLAGFLPLPRKQVYAGTKSYLISFSKSLRAELSHKNIHVTVLCPGGMNTTIPITLLNKNGTWIGRMSILNPEVVAKIAIDKMLLKKELIIPGFLNKCLLFLDHLLPAVVKNKLASNISDKIRPDKTLHLIHGFRPDNRFYSPMI